MAAQWAAGHGSACPRCGRLCPMFGAWRPPAALQLRNTTAQLQELLVVVAESQGFVYSGDKQQALSIAPRETSTVKWMLVAHATGLLPCPAVKVTASRLLCQVVTQSSYVSVLPF